MGPDDMIANLSGGNQQKVIFGKMAGTFTERIHDG